MKTGTSAIDAKFAKTQELLFEMKVSDVMRKDVIVMNPDQMMSKLRETLRDHRISGVPVVEDGKLVGIISIESMISWLNSGGEDCPLHEYMTSDPECLFPDQLLYHASQRFDRMGFGRFPVVSRETEELVGIVTKGLLIEGVLKKMARALREEELRQYRASHIFEDIVAEYKELYLTYDVIGGDFDQAGKASTQMKRNLKRLGIRPDVIHRLAIASYEAEMNLVIYTKGGTMEFEIAPDKITMRVKDKGPGIEDVDKVMQQGYSTAADWVRELGFGAGMGIPNIKKCSDEMELTSTLGEGTTLVVKINTGE